MMYQLLISMYVTTLAASNILLNIRLNFVLSMALSSTDLLYMKGQLSMTTILPIMDPEVNLTGLCMRNNLGVERH